MPTQTAKSKMSLENRLVTAKGEGGGGRMDWELGISRCKLLLTYIETTRPYCTGGASRRICLPVWETQQRRV